MQSTFYKIKDAHNIPYYEQTQKRTWYAKIKKVKNTVLALIAYSFPNNTVRVKLHKWRGVNIGKGVYIGMYCFIDNLYPDYIYIENYASINTGSIVLAHFNPRLFYAPIFEAKVAPVLIQEGAIVTVKCVLLPGVKIGRYAIVSAGSVVESSVADYTIVRGNPAKVVTKYKPTQQMLVDRTNL